jgi:hypothetical protein
MATDDRDRRLPGDWVGDKRWWIAHLPQRYWLRDLDGSLDPDENGRSNDYLNGIVETELARVSGRGQYLRRLRRLAERDRHGRPRRPAEWLPATRHPLAQAAHPIAA